ncbi:MAG: hypothetical protein ACREVE_02490 [Gammaproteobacteria bacterium]
MFGIGQERDDDPVIARFHSILERFVKQASGILRDEGFDPDAVIEEVDTELSRRGQHQRRVTTSTYAFIPPGDGKLGDPTEPAFAARNMLWEARLMLELMNEPGIDAVAVAHAFNLGRLVKLAELGMQFPDIACEMNRRKNKIAAARPRPDALQKLINQILEREPSLDTNEVRVKLENHAHQGIIYSVTDEVIEWEAGKGRIKTTKAGKGRIKTTTIEQLKHRVSRAKRIIKKSL